MFHPPGVPFGKMKPLTMISFLMESLSYNYTCFLFIFIGDRPLFHFHYHDDLAAHGVLAILNLIVRVYCDITFACSFICWNRCTNYTVSADINGLTLTDFLGQEWS